MSQTEQPLRSRSAADRARHWLSMLLAAMPLSARRVSQRRKLTALSESQLRDAGIDPSLAGRGKAAAASAATLRRLESFSAG